MIAWLMRFLGLITDEREERQLDKFDPIYGLPYRSLDEWLSRNPSLKKDYEAKLQARSLRRRSARDENQLNIFLRRQQVVRIQHNDQD